MRRVNINFFAIIISFVSRRWTGSTVGFSLVIPFIFSRPFYVTILFPTFTFFHRYLTCTFLLPWPFRMFITGFIVYPICVSYSQSPSAPPRSLYAVNRLCLRRAATVQFFFFNFICFSFTHTCTKRFITKYVQKTILVFVPGTNCR